MIDDMSSDSSSPDASPRPFRPRSPGSDDDLQLMDHTRTSSAYSSHFQPSTASTSVLRQPVGFSWNAPSTSAFSTYQDAPATLSAAQFLPVRGYPNTEYRSENPSRAKSVKGKEKEKDKTKSSSRKHRDEEQRVAQSHHVPPSVNAPPPDAAILTGQQTAFRVRSYVNDPNARGSPTPRATGPYTSDYRTVSSSPSVHAHSPAPGGAPATHNAAPQEQLPRTYYRLDYERQRDNAPARIKARMGANNLPPNTYTHAPTTIPSHQSQYSQDQYVNADPSHHGYTDVHMSEHGSLDQAGSHFENYSTSSPMPVSPLSDKHGSSDRRQKSRKHKNRSDPHHGDYFAPQPVATPAPSVLPSHSTVPGTKPARVLRILTLLIEDKRKLEPENLLVEIYVPLKQADNPEDGFWANAQEVCEELQKGPSRIDGRAKVYTTRGKYRQYFLRIPPEGGAEYTSANLKVTRERTLEIFVDDNPLPASGSSYGSNSTRYSTPHYARELLTPITDSMATTPSPLRAPRPMSPSPYERLSTDNPSIEDYIHSGPPRKRRRSISPQSSISEYETRTSPERQRSPVVRSSPVPRPSSITQTSPMARRSPISRQPSRSYSPAPAPSSVQPVQQYKSRFSPSTFPHSSSSQQYPAPSRSPAHSLPSPSSPKKPKHDTASSRMKSFSERMDHAWSRPRSPSTHVPSLSASTTFLQKPFTPTGRVSIQELSSQSNSLPNPSTQPNQNAPYSSHTPPPTTDTVSPDIDNIVGTYLRPLMCQGSAWDAFVEGRRSVLRMSEQLKQYQYMKDNFDRYVNTLTPHDLPGAADVSITRAHVLGAFNLSTTWGEECMEILALTAMYGPSGKRREDSRVVAMLDEQPPISTGMQVKKYLTLLREVHSRWTIDHPDF